MKHYILLQDRIFHSKEKTKYHSEHHIKIPHASLASDIFSELNFYLLICALGSIALLPYAIEAVLNPDATTALINDLSNLLTTYYLELNLKLDSLLSSITTILNRTWK